MKNLVKYSRGDSTILIFIMVFVVITMAGIIFEVYRIYILQQHAEYELQRAVNCAVEYAMGDSWRQDKNGRLNVPLAKSEFYRYMEEDLGLDSSNRKYNQGKLIYTLKINRIIGNETPPSLEVSTNLKAKSVFNFLVDDIEIPIKIVSRNVRAD